MRHSICTGVLLQPRRRRNPLPAPWRNDSVAHQRRTAPRAPTGPTVDSTFVRVTSWNLPSKEMAPVALAMPVCTVWIQRINATKWINELNAKNYIITSDLYRAASVIQWRWIRGRLWNSKVKPRGCILWKLLMFCLFGADSRVRMLAIIQLLLEWELGVF